MDTVYIVLLMIAAASFGLLSIIVYHGASQKPVNRGQSIAETLSSCINRTALGFVTSFKLVMKALFLVLLLAGQRLTTWSKYFLHQLEKKFSSLIESVRGRRSPPPDKQRRAAVSFFLEQIKLHRDETIGRTNRR